MQKGTTSNFPSKFCGSLFDIRNSPVCANIMICLIHQANYLLDQQLKQLEADFLKEGGFTERLYHSRRRKRGDG